MNYCSLMLKRVASVWAEVSSGKGCTSDGLCGLVVRVPGYGS
jgi:hypothetical protein